MDLLCSRFPIPPLLLQSIPALPGTSFPFPFQWKSLNRLVLEDANSQERPWLAFPAFHASHPHVCAAAAGMSPPAQPCSHQQSQARMLREEFLAKGRGWMQRMDAEDGGRAWMQRMEAEDGCTRGCMPQQRGHKYFTSSCSFWEPEVKICGAGGLGKVQWPGCGHHGDGTCRARVLEQRSAQRILSATAPPPWGEG